MSMPYLLNAETFTAIVCLESPQLQEDNFSQSTKLRKRFQVAVRFFKLFLMYLG